MVDSPISWTNIDVGLGIPFLHLCLERSKSALVDFKFEDNSWPDIPPSIHEDIVLMLMPVGHRIRNLHLTWITKPTIEKLLSQFTLTMPKLEGLSIFPRSIPPWTCAHPFDVASPALRRLRLKEMSVSWISPMLCGLVKLELEDGRKISVPSMDVFLDILDACPGLTKLTLKLSGPILPFGVAEFLEPMRHVSLPHIKKVLLYDMANNLAYLLAHLVISSSAQLHMELHCDSDEPVDHEDALVLTDLLPHDRTGLSNLVVAAYLHITYSLGYFHITAYPFGYGTCLDVELCQFVDDHSLLLPHALRDLADVFAASVVTCLIMDADMNRMDVVTWLSVLTQLSLLEELKVGCYSDNLPLFVALQSSPINADTGLMVPHLKFLTVNRFSLNEESLVPGIVACLQDRAAAGSRLVELEFIESFSPEVRFREQDVEAMRAVVGHFRCSEDGLPLPTVP
ncbi:hypothetical protein BKA93DRAFT_826421 [Sparassis latifolia]